MQNHDQTGQQIHSQTIIQGRLTKSEWNNMEIPVSVDELSIIKLIRDSYHNVQLKMNGNTSMIGVLKTSSSPEMHAHLYQKHFESIVSEYVKIYKLVPAFSCDNSSSSSISSGHHVNKNGKNKITEIKTGNTGNGRTEISSSQVNLAQADIVTKNAYAILMKLKNKSE